MTEQKGASASGAQSASELFAKIPESFHSKILADGTSAVQVTVQKDGSFAGTVSLSSEEQREFTGSFSRPVQKEESLYEISVENIEFTGMSKSAERSDSDQTEDRTKADENSFFQEGDTVIIYTPGYTVTEETPATVMLTISSLGSEDGKTIPENSAVIYNAEEDSILTGDFKIQDKEEAAEKSEKSEEEKQPDKTAGASEENTESEKEGKKESETESTVQTEESQPAIQNPPVQNTEEQSFSAQFYNRIAGTYTGYLSMRYWAGKMEINPDRTFTLDYHDHSFSGQFQELATISGKLSEAVQTGENTYEITVEEVRYHTPTGEKYYDENNSEVTYIDLEINPGNKITFYMPGYPINENDNWFLWRAMGSDDTAIPENFYAFNLKHDGYFQEIGIDFMLSNN